MLLDAIADFFHCHNFLVSFERNPTRGVSVEDEREKGPRRTRLLNKEKNQATPF